MGGLRGKSQDVWKCWLGEGCKGLGAGGLLLSDGRFRRRGCRRLLCFAVGVVRVCGLDGARERGEEGKIFTASIPPFALKVSTDPWLWTCSAEGSNRVTRSHCLMGKRSCWSLTTTSLCVQIASFRACKWESCLQVRKQVILWTFDWGFFLPHEKYLPEMLFKSRPVM